MLWWISFQTSLLQSENRNRSKKGFTEWINIQPWKAWHHGWQECLPLPPPQNILTPALLGATHSTEWVVDSSRCNHRETHCTAPSRERAWLLMPGTIPDGWGAGGHGHSDQKPPLPQGEGQETTHRALASVTHSLERAWLFWNSSSGNVWSWFRFSRLKKKEERKSWKVPRCPGNQKLFRTPWVWSNRGTGFKS